MQVPNANGVSASDDIVEPELTRRLLRDLREVRQAKARKGIETIGETHLQMDNLGMMEINEIRFGKAGQTNGIFGGYWHTYLKNQKNILKYREACGRKPIIGASMTFMNSCNRICCGLQLPKHATPFGFQ